MKISVVYCTNLNWSLDRVTKLIEDVADDIETGNKELEQAAIKVVNSRKKIMWITFILSIVSIIVVIALCFI